MQGPRDSKETSDLKVCKVSVAHRVNGVKSGLREKQGYK